MTTSEGWVGVDLDGTVAHYEGWRGELHIGAPIPLMVERIKVWLAQGKEVRIFTARVDDSAPLDMRLEVDLEGVRTTLLVARDFRVREAIGAWCQTHIGQRLTVTNHKDYAMVELYDDRAVQVEANTGRLIGHSTRGLA